MKHCPICKSSRYVQIKRVVLDSNNNLVLKELFRRCKRCNYENNPNKDALIFSSGKGFQTIETENKIEEPEKFVDKVIDIDEILGISSAKGL
jgi:methylphosphotriester-DNA--protein-cysteine methyltransferase